MEYIVVKSKSKIDFEEQVELHLTEGYELQGGVSVTVDRNDAYAYFQAMIYTGDE